jgi:prevent-host-death family protein
MLRKTLIYELYTLYNRSVHFAMPKTGQRQTLVVSALHARSSFGRLLTRVENERHSLLIEKRGVPRAVLISLSDYIRLAAPEPEVLRLIGEESESHGTSKLTSRQIDAVIRAARPAARSTKRRHSRPKAQAKTHPTN